MTHEGSKPLVVVTGAAGLVGSALVDALTPRYRTVGLDRSKPDNDLMDWIECDLTSDSSTAGAFQEIERRHGRSIASLVHLAAYYDFSGEPSPLYRTLTVDGTVRVLRELRRRECEQFVFSSSLLVMEPASEGEILTESSPTQAEWDYPKSKLAAEKAIAEERGTIPAVILRIAGIYDEDCHSIPIAQQIRRIYERKLVSHFYPGDRSHGQSFVHLQDVVRCFLQVIERRKELRGREVFLVGEPEVESYGELQDSVGLLAHGKEWTTLRIPKPLAKAGAWMKSQLEEEEGEVFIKPWMIDLADAHYPVSPEKAEAELGWVPRRRLRDTLPAMVERLKKDPRGWYEENSLPFPEGLGEAAR
jgi:nucleoside-diphosphate-sugar epimerase